MNSRERTLAISIGSLVVCLVLWYAYDSVVSSLDQQAKAVNSATDKLEGKQKQLKIAQRAVKRLREYEGKSLPADGELARSLYQTWLLQRLEKAGLRDLKLNVTGTKKGNDSSQRHTFNVGCRGNLQQLVGFLHELYSIDRLHRVQRLSIKPVADTKDLDIGFGIEALSLRGADATNKLIDMPAQRLRQGDVAEYERVIVGRNLFAPENRAPRIASSGSQTGYPSQSLRFSVKAEDPDKLDQVTFKLAEGAPTGARVDPKTGDFSWTPKEKGEFTATVIATDNGLPAKSDTKVIKIAVTDPPPPPKVEPVKKKLDFDDAKYTFVTALLDIGGTWEVWLTVRTSGAVHKLHEGEKVNIGSVEGKITKVEAGMVEIETPERRFQVSLGDNLLQGVTSPAGS
ncbi:MAG: Ig domain-containing protein [Pirellulales bacterium]